MKNMENQNIWEYKVGNNANLPILCVWENPHEMSSHSIPGFGLGNNYIDISLLWETPTKIEDTFISVFYLFETAGRLTCQISSCQRSLTPENRNSLCSQTVLTFAQRL